MTLDSSSLGSCTVRHLAVIQSVVENVLFDLARAEALGFLMGPMSSLCSLDIKASFAVSLKSRQRLVLLLNPWSVFYHFSLLSDLHQFFDTMTY